MTEEEFKKPALTFGITIHWSACPGEFEASLKSVEKSIRHSSVAVARHGVELIVAFDGKPAKPWIGLGNTQYLQEKYETFKRSLRGQEGVTVRYFETTVNQGAPTLRNAILRFFGTGQWVMLLDGDDTIPPRAIGYVLEAITNEANLGADVISFCCLDRSGDKTPVSFTKSVWGRAFSTGFTCEQTVKSIKGSKCNDGPFMMAVRQMRAREVEVGKAVIKYSGARGTQTLDFGPDFYPPALNQILQITGDIARRRVKLKIGRLYVDTNVTYPFLDPNNLFAAFGGALGYGGSGYGCFTGIDPEDGAVHISSTSRNGPANKLALYSIFLALITYPEVLEEEQFAKCCEGMWDTIFSMIYEGTEVNIPQTLKNTLVAYEGKQIAFIEVLKTKFAWVIKGSTDDLEDFWGRGFEGFCRQYNSNILNAFRESLEKTPHYIKVADSSLCVTNDTFSEGIRHMRDPLKVVRDLAKGKIIVSPVADKDGKVFGIQREELPSLLQEELTRNTDIGRKLTEQHRLLMFLRATLLGATYRISRGGRSQLEIAAEKYGLDPGVCSVAVLSSGGKLRELAGKYKKEFTRSKSNMCSVKDFISKVDPRRADDFILRVNSASRNIEMQVEILKNALLDISGLQDGRTL